MFSPLIRLLSFFAKEVNEIRRQPRLVLSLLLGPFLILLLFGVGYQGGQPQIRTVLVLPPAGVDELDVSKLKELSALNFKLVSTDTNYDQAMAMLANGQVDLVQVLPADVRARALRGERSTIEFKYNEINPINEQWLQYLAYAEISELNRQIVLNAAASMQTEAQTTRSQLAEVRQQLDAAQGELDGPQREQLQKSVRQLKQTSGLLAYSALLSGSAGTDAQQTRDQLLALQDDLDTLDQALNDGTIDQQTERIAQTRDRIATLEQQTEQFSAIPPQVIVSPLQQTYLNLNGPTYDLMTYYAPAVVALLIQHIAVTLGALSLVRERLLGAVELFRVAPVSTSQVLLGKYLGYTLFIGIITAILLGLMLLLRVPFLGSATAFAEVALLLTLASLGIGFFISAISTSDSQAVQLSMLVLLLSIFFSGFFLPLDSFTPLVRAIGFALPQTHGITAFRSIMLRGQSPDALVWTALGLIASVSFLAALFFSARQFRKP